MENETPFFLRKKTIIIGIIFAAFIVWAFFAFGGEDEPVIDTEVARRGELVQEVSVTGTVQPAERVDLSFETSGRVREIFAQVGDKVVAGQKLISLENDDISALVRQAQAGVAAASAQLQQYQAVLDSQVAKLNEMKKGTRPEELQLSQTLVTNAEKQLEDAERNLETVIARAEADLQSAYSGALNSLPIAVDAGKIALMALSDIQYNNDFGTNESQIENAQESAVFILLGGTNAGKWVSEFISKLNGGVYGEVKNLDPTATDETIDRVLTATLNALRNVKSALDTVPVTQSINDADAFKLESQKLAISSQISTLSELEKSINTQKAANQNLITAAQNGVNAAQNNLDAAQDELELKQAGYQIDQIQAQEALVRQAEANVAAQRAQLNSQYASVQQYQAQLNKTVLSSPIDGLVTKMEAKIGEIVFPSSQFSPSQYILVSIISEQKFEIETNVAEVDIAKIEIGDPSRVTLDAYGNDKELEAVVTMIDPAETIIEGIPTYTVTLQFVEQEDLIKPGMTANLDIVTAKAEDVITLPQRAVLNLDGRKVVRKMVNGIISEVEVETGLRGLDGRIEILDGVQEGDVIVISITE